MEGAPRLQFVGPLTLPPKTSDQECTPQRSLRCLIQEILTHRRMCGCRCVGWAQCSKCPRPDGDTPVPPGADRARCAPYPVKSCPVAGAHCPPPVTCCSKTPGGLSHACREFLPAKCSPMPAVNCTPNIPPSGWAVFGWKPSPAAYRSDPMIQMPSKSCREGK